MTRWLPFALCLAACSPIELGPAPDAATDTGAMTADAGPCGGACGPGTACTAGRCVAVDAGGLDAGRDGGAVDAGPGDTGQPDAGGGDAGADVVEADVYGACIANGLRTCDGRSVNVQVGERDDAGVRHHCGACGVTCASGEVCDLCRCAR